MTGFGDGINFDTFIISFVEIAGDFIISLLLLVDNWHGLDGSFWTGLDGSFWPPLGSF